MNAEKLEQRLNSPPYEDTGEQITELYDIAISLLAKLKEAENDLKAARRYMRVKLKESEQRVKEAQDETEKVRVELTRSNSVIVKLRTALKDAARKK